MKEFALLCLILISCIQIEQPVNEAVYKSEVVNVTEAVPEIISEVSSNIDILEPEIITNESVPSEAELITGSVIEDLSIGKQDKLIPVLESAVSNSSCYNITWNGFDEQSARWPLEIKKGMRFEYLGGMSWKGWVTSKLFISRKMLAANTVSVNIEDLSISCIDAKNFSIDWNRTLASHIK